MARPPALHAGSAAMLAATAERCPAAGRSPESWRGALPALPGERGFALLTGCWRTLQHITASPGKVGDIASAALILTHFECGYIR